jgi:DNA end-binding protein Ku
MKIVEKKVKAGDTETVIQPEEEAPEEASNVIDLTELLQRSLKGGGSAKAKAPAARKRGAKTTAKTTTKATTKAKARKTPAKKAGAAARKAA